MTAAQQTSLRVLATEPLTGSRRPAPSEYDEAAAAPASPPNASVTTSEPPAKSKPYGVAPEDGDRLRPLGEAVARRPSKVLMLFVPRSVTTSMRPSGLNAICAGSASRALSVRCEPSIGSSEPRAIAKPAIPGEPLFRT